MNGSAMKDGCCEGTPSLFQVNKRVVCILLQCFLVNIEISLQMHSNDLPGKGIVVR